MNDRRAQFALYDVHLTDIKDMPGFDPKVPNGADSVSRGLIFVANSGGRDSDGLVTVCCALHGAVLCVAKNDSGRIWRCPTCNEGAFEPNEE